MPFGLKNAPTTFQRLMDIVLKGTTDFCQWYIDDISIFSLTWDTHILTVLTRLQSSGLTLQLPKCLFGAKTCEFLGHRIGPGYISPQQAKVDAVANFVRPVRKKDIRSFLGLAGYYSQYIPRFSCIAAPLSDLTRIQGPDIIEWTPECQQAFKSLKQSISSQPTLAPPDYSKPFLLQTLQIAELEQCYHRPQIKEIIPLPFTPGSFLTENNVTNHGTRRTSNCRGMQTLLVILSW